MKRYRSLAFIFILNLLLSQLTIWGMENKMDDKDTRPVKNVAILLYDGVEILDFAGPVEVFEIAGLFREDSKYQTNVYTFSISGEPILSQNCVTVDPEFSLADCPKPDILVLPGGQTGEVVGSEQLITWLKNLYKENKTIMSVCTGAFLLSKANLLEGKDATTWHGQIENLRKKSPNAKVREDVRFVDNGTIITTAGVSAGIDGALHLVIRMFGENAAKNTAKYMEYDKWVPDDGLVVK